MFTLTEAREAFRLRLTQQISVSAFVLRGACMRCATQQYRFDGYLFLRFLVQDHEVDPAFNLATLFYYGLGFIKQVRRRTPDNATLLVYSENVK
jgi:hypothetical protein